MLMVRFSQYVRKLRDMENNLKATMLFGCRIKRDLMNDILEWMSVVRMNKWPMVAGGTRKNDP